jgi:hypothetical protein
MQRVYLFCLVLFAACTTPTSPQDFGPSPLGADNPHPEAILQAIIRANSEHDWAKYCLQIAVPGERGEAVALVPGKNAPASAPADAWKPADDFAGLGSFLSTPGKTVRFGPATELVREGPLLFVPVHTRWDFEKLSEAEKRMLIAAASARAGQPVEWQDACRPLRTRMELEASGLAKAPRLAFARVDGQWRLWLGPVGAQR